MRTFLLYEMSVVRDRRLMNHKVLERHYRGLRLVYAVADGNLSTSRSYREVHRKVSYWQIPRVLGGPREFRKVPGLSTVVSTVVCTGVHEVVVMPEGSNRRFPRRFGTALSDRHCKSTHCTNAQEKCSRTLSRQNWLIQVSTISHGSTTSTSTQTKSIKLKELGDLMEMKSIAVYLILSTQNSMWLLTFNIEAVLVPVRTSRKRLHGQASTKTANARRQAYCYQPQQYQGHADRVCIWNHPVQTNLLPLDPLWPIQSFVICCLTKHVPRWWVEAGIKTKVNWSNSKAE